MLGTTPVLALAVLCTQLGCSDAATSPTWPSETRRAYWALTLDHHAATLAMTPTNNTIQVSATPRDADGNALTGGTLTFRSTDITKATVSASGLVTAVAVSSGTQIIAEQVIDNVRRSDTLIVNVTAAAPSSALTTLEFGPIAPDSAKRPANTSVTLAARPMDANPSLITGVAVYYTSSDPTIASINRQSGSLSARRPGQVTLTASATAYGVTKSASLTFTVIYPVSGDVFVKEKVASDSSRFQGPFEPSDIYISPGGTVRWFNTSKVPVDVTFTDPSGVAAKTTVSCSASDPGGSGDIPTFGDATGVQSSVANCRSRSFPAAGTYTYHNTQGATGRVIVQ